MPDEIEVKFQVADFAPLEQSLQASGADRVAAVLQTDDYYDTPQRSLRGGDCGIRLRRFHLLDSGEDRGDPRALLTYKGPAGPSARAKVRRELQTRVDDPDVLAGILTALGFELTVSVQKRRTTWRLRECLVELDELPLIGRFVEIEGPDEAVVHEVAEALRLPGEPITAHYLALLAQHTPEVGTSRHRVHFEDRVL